MDVNDSMLETQFETIIELEVPCVFLGCIYKTPIWCTPRTPTCSSIHQPGPEPEIHGRHDDGEGEHNHTVRKYKNAQDMINLDKRLSCMEFEDVELLRWLLHKHSIGLPDPILWTCSYNSKRLRS